MALYKSANALLKRLTATHHTSPYGVGSSGVSIYDTAWVSIVSRNVEQTGTRAWVFPKSFEYICSSQAEDGGWHGDGSLIDSIMNTLASLLSLKLHEKDGWQLPDLSDKVERARLFLDNVLQKWDVPSTERIAFELIVPRILQFLEEEGISFEFPHRAALENLRDQKLKLLDLDLVYRGQTPVLYTLEAFVGVLDFDRLRTLKVNGSFLTSPASTAAYLTYCSVWDEEAEDYLRQALRRCSAYGEGAVCTVWPTTLFEFSWTICNLMESGFEREKLDESCLNRVGQVLHSALVAGNGLVGWDGEYSHSVVWNPVVNVLSIEVESRR
ncbi:copalyl diphosphate synthase [Moniliophthora roreri MCA 2997]|uniref:Copalyl diphosphate synthase n=1 Tax=Moniliophthora roreri (strain MCA 2997) TaxID=1381753 RepID=V2X5F2_MONRO|nr:copalyl diphosphate synthase [Moniliophthora roreri MCA 2997]